MRGHYTGSRATRMPPFGARIERQGGAEYLPRPGLRNRSAAVYAVRSVPHPRRPDPHTTARHERVEPPDEGLDRPGPLHRRRSLRRDRPRRVHAPRRRPRLRQGRRQGLQRPGWCRGTRERARAAWKRRSSSPPRSAPESASSSRSSSDRVPSPPGAPPPRPGLRPGSFRVRPPFSLSPRGRGRCRRRAGAAGDHGVEDLVELAGGQRERGRVGCSGRSRRRPRRPTLAGRRAGRPSRRAASPAASTNTSRSRLAGAVDVGAPAPRSAAAMRAGASRSVAAAGMPEHRARPVDLRADALASGVSPSRGTREHGEVDPRVERDDRGVQPPAVGGEDRGRCSPPPRRARW